jgi:hypothetical protein
MAGRGAVGCAADSRRRPATFSGPFARRWTKTPLITSVCFGVTRTAIAFAEGQRSGDDGMELSANRQLSCFIGPAALFVSRSARRRMDGILNITIGWQSSCAVWGALPRTAARRH